MVFTIQPDIFALQEGKMEWQVVIVWNKAPFHTKTSNLALLSSFFSWVCSPVGSASGLLGLIIFRTNNWYEVACFYLFFNTFSVAWYDIVIKQVTAIIDFFSVCVGLLYKYL